MVQLEALQVESNVSVDDAVMDVVVPVEAVLPLQRCEAPPVVAKGLVGRRGTDLTYA